MKILSVSRDKMLPQTSDSQYQSALIVSLFAGLILRRGFPAFISKEYFCLVEFLFFQAKTIKIFVPFSAYSISFTRQCLATAKIINHISTINFYHTGTVLDQGWSFTGLVMKMASNVLPQKYKYQTNCLVSLTSIHDSLYIYKFFILMIY